MNHFKIECCGYSSFENMGFEHACNDRYPDHIIMFLTWYKLRQAITLQYPVCAHLAKRRCGVYSQALNSCHHGMRIRLLHESYFRRLLKLSYWCSSPERMS